MKSEASDRAFGPVEEARRQGREHGFDHGFNEGYLRGHANVIFNTAQEHIPVRPIHVLYVSTGKGFPYSPIDEAIVTTLQSMVAKVTPTDPRQPVAAQAAELRPDLVLVVDGMELKIEQVHEIRAHGIRTAIWLTDDPYYTDITSHIVPQYDHVFTLELNSVPYYQSLGHKSVHYLAFGFHPEQYRPISTISKLRRDVSFIGSGYWNRVAYFDQLTPYLAKKNVVLSGLWWDRLRDYETMQSKIELDKWMGPQETSDIYNGSKIVINMHRAHDDTSVNSNTTKITALSPNIRTFEISASGTLQLTDIRDDLARYYTPGVEIETYSSPEELIEKVEFYLNHEKERREIALRALKRSIREHTYHKRLNTLLSKIYD
ncbi:spore maturation protein cgeB [Paenibacillus selenitireducens]|uniref:Spore maturation protein cgeB n=1 Tax=Paenibacillus selenitireducens TaxID=1324314 RepID=A0A1T2XL69_9BACL|nr:spore maturation protein cgeB [Paenibacillus selenitireducens]